MCSVYLPVLLQTPVYVPFIPLVAVDLMFLVAQQVEENLYSHSKLNKCQKYFLKRLYICIADSKT